MYLSKMNILGFKSFANKTKLEFNEGISCVIGPNGSGKSNIVDALRWVLGEQKVNTLRSDKMESVIFNGTNQRKALGMAEVSLTIQNTHGILDSEYTEVVITRRLYRSGESQYLLNRTICRLKDILNLFMDTGLGPNSYSVIELKMVESIISENASERRLLFEEAAGVTKYKIRRRSALRKLDATHSDMERISDLIQEIQRTVNSLSRQVGKARRYLKYKEEIRTKELDLARFRYTRFIDEIQPLEQQLGEIQSIKDDTSHQITLEEALLEDYRREIIDIEQQLAKFFEHLTEQDNQIHLLHEQDAVGKTRIESIQITRERNEKEIQENIEKIKHIKSDIEAYNKEIAMLNSDVEQLQEEYGEKNTVYAAAAAELQAEKVKIDELNLKYRQEFENLSAYKESVQKDQYQFNFNTERSTKLDEEIKDSATRIDHLSKTLADTQKEHAKFKSELEKQIAHVMSLDESRQISESKIHELRDQHRTSQSKQESLHSRIAFFEQMINRFEGHTKSTRFVMTHKNEFDGLHGPLADLVAVAPEYETALEAALGNAVDFLVVDSVTIAQNIIERMRTEHMGRVTLLPLDRIKNLSAPKPNGKANYTLLSEIIECAPDYALIFRIMLGDIAVVDSLADALEAARTSPDLRFVSRDGEIVAFGRQITGGEKQKSDASLIGRQDQLKQLKKDSLKETKAGETLLAQIEKESATLEKLKQDSISAQSESEKIRALLSESEKEEARQLYEMETAEKRLQAMRFELAEISKKLNTQRGNVESADSVISEKQLALNEIEKQTIALTNAFDLKNEDVSLQSQEVQELRLKLLNEQNQLQNRQNDLKRSTETISDLNHLNDRRRKENVDLEQERIDIDSKIDERRGAKELIWAKRDSIEKEKGNIEIGYRELKDKILNLENQIKKYRKQHDSSLERVKQLELTITENQTRAEGIKERIQQDYNEDVSIGIAYDGLDEDETAQNIETLKFKIQQLGQVNPLAVSEYDKESERLAFFTKQYDDLVAAEESLQETIKKINITARRQFTETFTKIKENFEIVFKSFFEHGEATLKLEENVDPLEAQVEISAKTKGKRVQTISLLSGGEKTLTAISLLFAIYRVKPSPFCILDEVDAPLDDINIGRFTTALHEFSKHTQFIVITHNKRTMEAANTMYGVTMEEEGLSKLVSVRFN